MTNSPPESGNFVDTLDSEISESMKDPEYAAAWRRIELREATYGQDKRQARRTRRRMGASSEATEPVAPLAPGVDEPTGTP